ncbi:MAG: ATP synthase F1 subunit epsilon, partial [Burkholderiales bacterium]|nr:ATP synthase F1 subunit epsilon [Anaerolineae bacterium]
PIHVEIVSQERKVFDEPEADMVVIPGVEGEMGILPHHAPVLTTLGFGELIVRKKGAEERFAIYGGVVDIRPDKVVVLADLAESSFDLNMEAVEAARQSAQKMVEEGVPGTINREATLALRRADVAAKITRSIQNRGPVMRIMEQDERE